MSQTYNNFSFQIISALPDYNLKKSCTFNKLSFVTRSALEIPFPLFALKSAPAKGNQEKTCLKVQLKERNKKREETKEGRGKKMSK